MTSWWVTVIVALIGFAGGYLVYKNKQSETKLSRENFVSEAAMHLLVPYREEVKNLRIEVEALKRRVNELTESISKTVNEIDCITAGAHLLHHQLMAVGIKPFYDPPERRNEAG